MLRFQVEGMSCGHCAQAVTQAVQGIDAGAEVTIDLASKTVYVRSSATSASVAEAIRQAGYEAAAFA